MAIRLDGFSVLVLVLLLVLVFSCSDAEGRSEDDYEHEHEQEHEESRSGLAPYPPAGVKPAGGTLRFHLLSQRVPPKGANCAPWSWHPLGPARTLANRLVRRLGGAGGPGLP